MLIIRWKSLEFYAKLLYLANNIGTPKELSAEKVTQLLELREKEKVYKVVGRHPGKKCFKKINTGGGKKR